MTDKVETAPGNAAVPVAAPVSHDVENAAPNIAATKDRSAELNAIIDKWHSDSFRGTAIARDAETWNIVFHAKEDLKQRLAAFIKEA